MESWVQKNGSLPLMIANWSDGICLLKEYKQTRSVSEGVKSTSTINVSSLHTPYPHIRLAWSLIHTRILRSLEWLCFLVPRSFVLRFLLEWFITMCSVSILHYRYRQSLTIEHVFLTIKLNLIHSHLAHYHLKSMKLSSLKTSFSWDNVSARPNHLNAWCSACKTQTGRFISHPVQICDLSYHNPCLRFLTKINFLSRSSWTLTLIFMLSFFRSEEFYWISGLLSRGTIRQFWTIRLLLGF